MPGVSETSPFRGDEYLADQSFASIRMDRTGQTTGVPMPELCYEHTGLWVVFAFRPAAILPKAGWRLESQPDSRPESISLEARVLALLASAGPMSKSAFSGALIANAFFRAGYIEAWGRGIEKIHRECREHDIPPPVVEVIALTVDEDEPALPKRRRPHPDIAGKGRTLGDLVSPVVKEIKP